MKTAAIDAGAIDERIAVLERQLGMTQGAQLAQRIAELEADLAERAEEQAVLYAAAQSWRRLNTALRDEQADLRKRVIEAQRAAVRDRGILERHKDETRVLRDELEGLQAQLSGTAAAQQAPVVRSLPHAPRQK